LENLIGRHVSPEEAQNLAQLGQERSVVASVGQDKHVILTAIPDGNVTNLAADEYKLRRCDLLLFTYDQDDQDSVAYIRTLNTRFSNLIPRVLLGSTASGLLSSRAPHHESIQEFAHSMDIKLYRQVQLAQLAAKDIKEVTEVILAASVEP
jgi:hypothetical protein